MRQYYNSEGDDGNREGGGKRRERGTDPELGSQDEQNFGGRLDG